MKDGDREGGCDPVGLSDIWPGSIIAYLASRGDLWRRVRRRKVEATMPAAILPVPCAVWNYASFPAKTQIRPQLVTNIYISID